MISEFRRPGDVAMRARARRTGPALAAEPTRAGRVHRPHHMPPPHTHSPRAWGSTSRSRARASNSCKRDRERGGEEGGGGREREREGWGMGAFLIHQESFTDPSALAGNWRRGYCGAFDSRRSTSTGAPELHKPPFICARWLKWLTVDGFPSTVSRVEDFDRWGTAQRKYCVNQ